MSDSDGKKTLGLRGTPRSGNVKQSFSHGRTKNVLVETKRKRVVVPKAGTPVQPGTNPAKTQSSNRPAGISDTEMARRLKAVQAAKAREAEDTATRAAEEENRQKERERRRAEQAEKEGSTPPRTSITRSISSSFRMSVKSVVNKLESIFLFFDISETRTLERLTFISSSSRCNNRSITSDPILPAPITATV